MQDILSKCDTLCKDILASSQLVKVHQCRSKTISNRVEKVFNAASNLDLESSDNKSLYAHAVLNMLLIAFEEISEYFKVIQSMDLTLGKRVKSFGSDGEMFLKWNETLKTCCRDLNLILEQNTFDDGQDQRDFNQDMKDLNANLHAIFGKLIDHFGSAEMVVAASQKLLDQQGNDMTQYKTQQAVKAEKIFDVNSIRYENVIGIGGFGEVWKARYKGDSVAIKKVPAKAIGLIAIAALKKEAEFMKKLSHPRIVSCFGILEHEGNFCMVMELCPNGSLASFMADKNSSDVNWDKRNDFAIDIATGMNYLHKLGVIHRDLKLGNVVLDEYDRAKITDFGLSVVKSATQTSLKLEECGTPQYMAPESFGLAPVFSTKTDVYAFAIVLWELSHWEVAYRHVSILEIKDSIKKGDRLAISDFVIEKIRALIVDCWAGNPKSRPTYAEILDRLQSTTIGKGSEMPFSIAVVQPDKLSSGRQNYRENPYLSSMRQIFIKKSKFSKNFILLGLISLVVVAIGAGVGIYYLATSNKSAADGSANLISTSDITTTISKSQSTSESINPATTPSKTTPDSSTASNTPSKSISRTPFPTATVSTVLRDDVNLYDIYGIAVDENDDLYVISPRVRVVYKVSATGSSVSLIADLSTDGQGTNGGYDQGICYFNKSLYVPRIGQLTKIDLANGNLVTRYAGTGTKGLMNDGQNTSAVFCEAISCIPDNLGNIYVGEGCNSIRKVDRTGSVTTVQTNLPNNVFAMLMNGTNNVLFTGWYPPAIYSVNLLNKQVTHVVGNSSQTYCPHLDGQGLSSKLCGSGGLAFDELGNLYVAESQSAVVSKVNSTLWVSVFAGSTSTKGQSDNVGVTATFQFLRQIVFDSQGRLFVADQGNNAIRMITW